MIIAKTNAKKIASFLSSSKGRIWFFVNMFFTILYLVWRIFFTIPFGFGAISVIAGVTLLVVEALGMVEAFVHYANMSSNKSYQLPNVEGEEFPDVDIFIATYSEEVDLLYKTINGCKYMEYPDLEKVHIYLCDDNRRPEMRKLAKEMGVHYLDRPDNKGAKAGNLNNAFKYSKSPYILTLDADMIPKSDFLMKTMPYFIDCERRNKGRKEEEQIRLGFVQTPQSFYNPDLFQFNLFSESRIPNEQDYFYRDIQVARTKTNSVIYGGSNTVLSRKALEDVGGFFMDAITEDFATGILIEKKGYVSLGIAEPLASGMSATDLQSLIQQRVRWGRGVIATGKKMKLFSSKNLSFSQKINYWASIWYWYAPIKRIIYMMSPILYASFGFMVFQCTLTQVLLFWLPMYITSNISLKMLSNNIRTTKWTSVYETVLFPFMLGPILLESFGISLKKFKVTKKEGIQNQKGKNIIYSIPFVILIALSVIGIVNCIIIMFDSSSFGPIIVVFWLVNNLYLMVMSLFFVDGRVPYRKAERVMSKIPAVIEDGMRRVEGMTRDISESGLSILMNQPYYLSVDDVIEIQLHSEKYFAKLQAQVLYVTQTGHTWSYSMKIKDFMGTYNEFLQMLYDRIPVLPQEIKKDSGSFDDLKLNTKKRVAAPLYQKRQYPRILLNVDVDYSLEGNKKIGKILLHDYNYLYVSVLLEEKIDCFILRLMKEIELICQYETEIRKGHKLYRVLNHQEIFHNDDLMNKLLIWLSETNQIALKKQEHSTREIAKERKEAKHKKEFDEIDLV